MCYLSVYMFHECIHALWIIRVPLLNEDEALASQLFPACVYTLIAYIVMCVRCNVLRMPHDYHSYVMCAMNVLLVCHASSVEGVSGFGDSRAPDLDG
jgi:hypothetical protein